MCPYCELPTPGADMVIVLSSVMKGVCIEATNTNVQQRSGSGILNVPRSDVLRKAHQQRGPPGERTGRCMPGSACGL